MHFDNLQLDYLVILTHFLSFRHTERQPWSGQSYDAVITLKLAPFLVELKIKVLRSSLPAHTDKHLHLSY